MIIIIKTRGRALLSLLKKEKEPTRRSMRMLMLTLATTVVTAGVVMNVYSKKKQFYPSVTYLFKSSRCMSVCIIYYSTMCTICPSSFSPLSGSLHSSISHCVAVGKIL